MRKGITLLAIILFLLNNSWLNNEVQAAANRTYIVTPDIGVNLRSQPTKDSAIVTKLKQGYRVEVLEEAGEWVKVSYNSQIGYTKAEFIKPLNQDDLISAYVFYDSVLKNLSLSDYNYTLLYDFTQDGIEELYVVAFEDNTNFIEQKLYSGTQLLIDEQITDGISVYWDEYNYYIVNESNYNRGIELPPHEIGLDLSYELLAVNSSIAGSHVIHPGNLKLNQTTLGYEWYEVHGYFEHEEFFDMNETIEVEEYSKNNNTINKEEYDKFQILYSDTPNELNLITFDMGTLVKNETYSSNLMETREKLRVLYANYSEEDFSIELTNSQITDIEQYLYRVFFHENNDSFENGKVNYLNLFGKFETLFAATFTDDLRNSFEPEIVMNGDVSLYELNMQKVDDWIYRFYGIKMNQELLKKELDEYIKSGESVSLKVNKDSYICQCDGLGGPFVQYKLKDIIMLEQDYIAIQYNEFSNDDGGDLESILSDANASKTGYVIVRKVNTAQQEAYYPYIAKLDSIENIDYNALNTYANQLDIMKNHKLKEEVKTAKAPAKETKNNRLDSNIIWYGLCLVVVLVGVSVFFLRRKKTKKE